MSHGQPIYDMTAIAPSANAMPACCRPLSRSLMTTGARPTVKTGYREMTTLVVERLCRLKGVVHRCICHRIQHPHDRAPFQDGAALDEAPAVFLNQEDGNDRRGRRQPCNEDRP